MPIKNDHSNLPKQVDGDSIHPDENPRFVTALADAWHAQYLADGKDKRAMSGDTPFRGSDAGACSFDLALRLLTRAGMGEESNPPSVADTWRMGLGTMVHSLMEDYLPKAFPGATCEVVGMTVENEVSFHADVLIQKEIPASGLQEEYTWRTLFELKTINGFGFKNATVGFKGKVEGPRENAVLQAGLAAESFDCDEVVIGYLSLECISVAEAKRRQLDDVQRFAAEWTFTREQYLPMVQAERARMRWIKALVDQGHMPDRTVPTIPEGAVITDPRSGAWSITDPDNPLTILDIGTTWMCGYCRNQDSCISLNNQGAASA